MVSAVLALAVALAIPVEDVTLPSGVRVIVSVDRAAQPAEIVVSRDRALVVVVGDVDPEKARAAYAAWPSPSPLPSTLPPPTDSTRESWQVRRGPAELTVEWPEAPPEDVLLTLQSLVAGSFERSGASLRYRGGGGWPPAERRALDVQLERLATAGARELAAVREQCLAWATPRTPHERAERLLQVTLTTGNPRIVRDLPERCARVMPMVKAKSPAALPSAARTLLGHGRRVRLIIPIE